MTHGLSNTPEYSVWCHMLHRCRNPKASTFEYYGGRGISVCQRWSESFEAFYRDVGPRPTSNHSIERVDVNGNYEPGNVVWATTEQQLRNRRNTRWVDYRGQRHTIASLAREKGMDFKTLKTRLQRGMTPEEAVEVPICERSITAFGKTQSAASWAAETGLPYGTIYTRLTRLKWPAEKVVSTPRRITSTTRNHQ